MDIRNEILSAIEKEIVGPSNSLHYKDETSGEEILLTRIHGTPKSRYGSGMLYPQKTVNIGIVDDGQTTDDRSLDGIELLKNSGKDIDLGNKPTKNTEENDNEEEPVGLANQYLPSAIGFTLRFNANQNDNVVHLVVKSAYYEKGAGQKPLKRIMPDGNLDFQKDKKGNVVESEYWIRRPITCEPIEFLVDSLAPGKSKEAVIKWDKRKQEWLVLKIFNRSTKEEKKSGFLTYTFALINKKQASTDDRKNSHGILYQNKLTLTCQNEHLIAPYKERAAASDTDEEKEMNLLYRQKRIFAIGHGTSARWSGKLDKVRGCEVVSSIETAVIPVYDLPQIAPTSHVELSMLELSDQGDWEKAKESLKELLIKYKIWIDEIEVQAKNSEELRGYRDTALKSVNNCKLSFERIEKGVRLLMESRLDDAVVKAFRWMNRSMLWQQQRSKTKIRTWQNTGKGKETFLVPEGIDGEKGLDTFPSLKEYYHSNNRNGRWRPFQLAFILMNIEALIDRNSPERKTVDLIWFPTGGGKTEAYLGLTALTIFLRRLKGAPDWTWGLYGGTTVIMRYTLRLLTTQQYERASSLICACEYIRKENTDELGEEKISIGLWVGGSSSPNLVKEARAQIDNLENNNHATYNFVVMKCPCCGCQIGKIKGAKNENKKNIVKGLYMDDGTDGDVGFKCENLRCEFSREPLPLQVVDEMIYKYPPTLLLGTVDKFAMIPWKTEAGALFGFQQNRENKKWTRICPPELIIQDELHLISGPLGSVVGLYETMVQTLCNDYQKNEPPFISKGISFISPKIIASSATISRAYEQVKNLYGISNRSQLNIFPAQGLSFGDTWFSEEKDLHEVNENGSYLYPGRKYIGLLPSGFPSAQTAIVRTYAIVLQKVKELSENETNENIDYYWTLLGYFNSIRELGGASSLVYGDIRERLLQIQSRENIPYKTRRYINKVEELTSRISSSEIPRVLKKLEVKFNNQTAALDISLATNMVATGVDIARLGLLFIHGQPKTTAEYIQASSRVGRDLPNGAGIIFTLYSPSKPRDKSQYEQFQSYHSRIYSNVEPTSVTPFSVNAREKVLHAVLIGLIRQFSQDSLRKNARITEEYDELLKPIIDVIVERCRIIDEKEVDNTLRLLDKKIDFWRKRDFQYYGDAGNKKIMSEEDYFPLMYSIGADVREDIIHGESSLATPSSMRGVDSESVLKV